VTRPDWLRPLAPGDRIANERPVNKIGPEDSRLDHLAKAGRRLQTRARRPDLLETKFFPTRLLKRLSTSGVNELQCSERMAQSVEHGRICPA